MYLVTSHDCTGGMIQSADSQTLSGYLGIYRLDASAFGKNVLQKREEKRGTANV